MRNKRLSFDSTISVFVLLVLMYTHAMCGELYMTILSFAVIAR